MVAGLRNAGAFDALAYALCARAKSTRTMGLLLVLLAFFSSMLITNDVALLTFVPFAVILLRMTGRKQDLIRVVVLQTAAANLGSMLTPVGNPQNLFLYAHYGFSTGEFFQITLPVWGIALALLALLCLTLPRVSLRPMLGERKQTDGKALTVYLLLFALCLLTVFRLVPWPVMLGLTAAVLLIFDRRMLLRADGFLLLTFVAFFIFAGNLARLPAVDRLLRGLLSGREYWVSLLTCQVISNVPAALLLSGFTDSGRELLLGTNIGGLGTPIASLASLIGLRLYSASEDARPGRYLLEFTVVNLLLLLLLTGAKLLLYR